MVLSLSYLKWWEGIKKSFEMFYVCVHDFVTDASHCKAFGVVLLDCVAEKWELSDVRNLFMSRDNSCKIENKLLSVSGDIIISNQMLHYKFYQFLLILKGIPVLNILKYFTNFELFDKPKTIRMLFCGK